MFSFVGLAVNIINKMNKGSNKKINNIRESRDIILKFHRKKIRFYTKLIQNKIQIKTKNNRNEQVNVLRDLIVFIENTKKMFDMF